MNTGTIKSINIHVKVKPPENVVTRRLKRSNAVGMFLIECLIVFGVLSQKSLILFF